MWVARNKKDTYESDSLVLWLDDEKPTRKDNGDGNYQYWFGYCGIELQPYTKVWYDRYKYLKWEDEPVEVDLYKKGIYNELKTEIIALQHDLWLEKHKE